MLMQNNFSKCREWVPRGTSQHKWRWLTTLLLILTLGIGQMWGATYNVTLNGGTVSSNGITLTGDYVAQAQVGNNSQKAPSFNTNNSSAYIFSESTNITGISFRVCRNTNGASANPAVNVMTSTGGVFSAPESDDFTATNSEITITSLSGITAVGNNQTSDNAIVITFTNPVKAVELRKQAACNIHNIVVTYNTATAPSEIFNATISGSTPTATVTPDGASLTLSVISSSPKTIGSDTYYKWDGDNTISLGSGKFQVGDQILADVCGGGNSKTVGFKVNSGTDEHTIILSATAHGEVCYTVRADDGVAGESSVKLIRKDANTCVHSFRVLRPAAACSEPAAPTISSNKDSYTVGETITLTASHNGTNHGESTTYTWYKGANWATASAAEAVQAAATGSAGYTLTMTAALADNGSVYWCEAANGTCKAHNETGKTIAVTSSSTPTHAITYNSESLKGQSVSGYPTEFSEGVGKAASDFPALADVTDFHFNGWSPASIGTDVTTDVEMTATWVAAYNVTFSKGTGGGTAPDAFQKWAGASFDLPGQGEMTAPSGKVFDGWKASGTKYAANAEYTMTAADVEFVAQWKNTPTTIFHWQSNISSNPSLDQVISATGGSLTTRSYKTSSKGSFQTQNVSGYVTGTPDDMKANSGKSGIKCNNNDVYLKLSLTSGKLQSGDTIWICGYGAIKMYKSITLGSGYNDEIASLTMSGTGTSNFGVNATACVIPQVGGDDVEYDSLCLTRNSNGYLAAIKIVRPAAKDIKSTAITLTDVKVNGTSISAANLSTLQSTRALALSDALTAAPTITFNKRTVITYDDDSQKVTNTPIEETATINGDGKWEASATIDAVEYTVTITKAVSTDATLKDLTVGGVTIAGFDPDTEEYNVVLEMGTSSAPTVAGDANNDNAKSVTPAQASTLPGDATITVLAEDNSTSKTYTIHFTVATSKDIELVWDKSKQRCDATTPDAVVKSDDATVSTYINKMTFTGGGEGGSSLNVGNTAGNMVTLTAKPGYAISAMSFYGKIEADDAKLEYSLNGGAWTDLASTNAGDACYADVFTAAEVHELRMRSAGNKGFWIRNMQLTIIEACTPIVVAWDEEPVEFEVGKSGYAIAATANNGGTVAYSSTDDAIVDVVAATGELTISGLGSATLKAATAEGDGSTYCANAGADIEISKDVNTYYLVKFDAQNGDAVAEHKYYSGDAAIALPATDPTFSGYDFQGWFDAETGGNQYTEAITPAASMTVYAQWVAQCAGATITTQPTGASYLTGRTAADLVCEATAGNGGALTYEWFTCDDEMRTNPVAATATPSTAVAGTFYYFCKVTEEGCAVEAFSDVVTITVADKDAICIIKSTPTSGTEATVDGVYQGNAYFKGRTADKKLNNPYDYVGVELASGYTFLATDKVVLNQTAALGTDDLSKFYVYVEEPAGGKTYVTVLNASPVQGNNWFAMPTENVGQSTLYVGRVDANCNPSVGYLAVYRESAPILSKITVNSVEGTPDNTNHVTIEVPASTTQGQLEAIAYEWVSNSDAWTAAHDPAAANAWEFGVENTVTFTDKDGDASEYYITVNKAAASSDATLSALTVNGQAIALADGVFDYSFELPYGTTVVPTVVATAHHAGAVATVDPCTLSGATITVVPESGAGDQQVYTLTFTISAWKEVAIFDGSYMTALATSPTDEKELRWEVVGFGGVAKFEYQKSYGEAYCSDNDKTYSVENASNKYEYYQLKSGGTTKSSRYFKISVPKDYVAQFYVVYGSHSQDTEAKMYVDTEYGNQSPTDQYLLLSTSDRYQLTGGMSEIVGAGDYYLNATNSVDFAEVRVYMRPGYARTAMLGNGVLGTVCVPNNVAVEDIQGVTVYELMGREPQYGKIAFDEIVSGELEAGVPYVFQANGDKMVMFYGEDHEDAPVDKGNGMYGTFTDQTLTELDDVYYFAQRALWSCVDLTSLSLPANRAYVKLSEIDYISDPNPAPGRRRITMTVNGEKVATDVENLNASEAPVKLIIDGKMYILRGEKLFDATGRLVK